MNPNDSTTSSERLAFPAPVNPKSSVQLALLPAPTPATRAFVAQPVQDALRLARPVVTVRAEAYL